MVLSCDFELHQGPEAVRWEGRRQTTLNDTLWETPAFGKQYEMAERKLVPFFVPGKEVVNENLKEYPAAAGERGAGGTAPVVKLRAWDKEEGFFGEAVDTSLAAPRDPQDGSDAKVQLLTPSGIMSARKAAKGKGKRAAGAKDAASLPVVPAALPPRSSPTSSPPRKQVARAPLASPLPQTERRFAGSTFEVASPAPFSLPIPGFVSRKVPEAAKENERVIDTETKQQVLGVKVLAGDDALKKTSAVPTLPVPVPDAPDMNEQAALDLRRMLRMS